MKSTHGKILSMMRIADSNFPMSSVTDRTYFFYVALPLEVVFVQGRTL